LDAFSRLVAHLNKEAIGLLGKLLDLLLLVGVDIFVLLQVGLGENDDKRLRLEQRFDVVEQRDLLLDCVAACFGDVHEEQDAGI
jgi:hypothetical protein